MERFELHDRVRVLHPPTTAAAPHSRVYEVVGIHCITMPKGQHRIGLNLKGLPGFIDGRFCQVEERADGSPR